MYIYVNMYQYIHIFINNRLCLLIITWIPARSRKCCQHIYVCNKCEIKHMHIHLFSYMYSNLVSRPKTRMPSTYSNVSPGLYKYIHIVYIYIYTYTYIYLYMYVNIYIYIYILHIFIYIYV